MITDNALPIPLFDLSPSSNTSSSLAHALVAAAHTSGFLFVRCPALFPPTAIHRLFALSTAFFALPPHDKASYPMQANNRGWTAPGDEVLDRVNTGHEPGDPKEAFNFGEFSNNQAQQPLPPLFTAAEAELAQFQDRCRQLCLRVLELIAEGLGVADAAGGRAWFATRHDPARGESGTILRLLHYPPSQGAVGQSTIRAGAHSDYGSMTLLFRQPGDRGLEIRPPRGSSASDEETWIPVPVSPPGTEDDAFPPILVNIGDLLSYWTGGWLRSTVHRVVVPSSGNADGSKPPNGHDPGHDGPEATGHRYSMAYFCHPARDTRLVPVPSEIVRTHVEQTRGQKEKSKQNGNSREEENAQQDGGRREKNTEETVLTATEHLQSRLRAAYGWGD